MRKFWMVGIAIALGVSLGLPDKSRAQDGDRTVEQYTCKDVMRETGSARDIAVAFLHGFLVGKGGASKFNVSVLQKQTDNFIESCLDNPGAKAVDVMMKVKS